MAASHPHLLEHLADRKHSLHRSFNSWLSYQFNLDNECRASSFIIMAH